MLYAIQTVTPPALEPVSAALVAQHLRLDTVEAGDLLSLYIATAREWAEGFLGRALITQTLRVVFAESATPAPYIAAGTVFSAMPATVGGWGLLGRSIPLPRPRVQAISTVKAYAADGTIATISTDGWAADTALEPARIVIDPAYLPPGTMHVEVTYAAGYGSTAASVPATIRNALLLMVAHLYEHRGDTEGEMPKAVQSLLWQKRVTTLG